MHITIKIVGADSAVADILEAQGVDVELIPGVLLGHLRQSEPNGSDTKKFEIPSKLPPDTPFMIACTENTKGEGATVICRLGGEPLPLYKIPQNGDGKNGVDQAYFIAPSPVVAVSVSRKAPYMRIAEYTINRQDSKIVVLKRKTLFEDCIYTLMWACQTCGKFISDAEKPDHQDEDGCEGILIPHLIELPDEVFRFQTAAAAAYNKAYNCPNCHCVHFARPAWEPKRACKQN